KPEAIEAILQQGAAKARTLAAPLLAELREAVGLRRFQPLAAATAPAAETKLALPVFKQYREADGQFYFKLSAHDGRVLLQSQAFASGRDAGQWVARFKKEGASALANAPVTRGADASETEIEQALRTLAAE
ncbi:MAG: DUF1508 domain-containing protein, partial [Burkholderiaceae bacterium]